MISPNSPLAWAAVFGNPEAQRILAYLQDQFWIKSATYQPGIPANDLFYREGQRSVIVMLTETIEAAIHQPTEVRDELYGQPAKDDKDAR